ncbi:MAG: glycosyltransferase family 2 protein [Albidovulum sp.]
MPSLQSDTSIGVIVVTFNAADVIEECLDSLMALEGAAPRIVVVDNSSTDDTVETARRWAQKRGAGAGLMQEGEAPKLSGTALGARVTLLHSGANRGFAGGVNIGLKALAASPEISHFWVLNPDAFADPKAALAILAAAQSTPDYGIIGGRVCYADPPHRIQIDGGTINRWTGVTSNINLGAPRASAVMPSASEMDFVTGANLVVSRQFYETVGPMREDYFLYYEEADWALRRGALPMIIAPGFCVYHHAGTAIGSPTLDRIASPFSFWFKYRSRMMFVRRFYPASLPVAAAYATAKAAQLMMKGAFPQAFTLLRAVFGLPAPKSVRDRLSPEAERIAFGKAGR